MGEDKSKTMGEGKSEDKDMGSIRRRGLMLVLSSPSGAGKTSLARELLAGDGAIDLSVSMTTRPRRPGEVDGKDYHFVSQADFQRLAAEGELLEHARVFDNFYGTPKAPVMATLAAGRDMLFDIDWQGTQQLAEHAPGDLVRIFILPPSTAELARRLQARARDEADEVARRMARAADEMSHYFEYDWIIINRDFDHSLTRIRAILTSERLRRKRQIGIGDFVKKLRGDP